jgi:hypothetical protein
MYRLVDELQKYKAHRIMKFIGGCPTTKMTKFIADMKRIYYAYLRLFMNVKPKNQKEVNHESFTSCKNLDGVSQSQFKKKIPFELTSGFQSNFVINSVIQN